MLIRIAVQPKQPSPQMPAIRVQPARVLVPSRAPRVLDFDIENRPLSYLGSDFTTGEVTAIAWAWTGTPNRVTVRLLGEVPLTEILREFVSAYNEADMVTGHYITGHDLPMINGALMECRMPALRDTWVQDTKTQMMRSKGLSLSQESLGAMFRLSNKKESMNQSQWRAANRLTPEGLAEVRRRVVGDVKQHIALRKELLAAGYLAAPKKWYSGTSRAEGYTP
jgi:hypothetical protein